MLVLGADGKTEKKFKENKGVFAVESDFFEMFDFNWLAGSPTASLADPNSAVLSKETAEKYFGDWRSAMGRIIRLDNQLLLKVTGVLATIPPNSDFQFKVVLPYQTLGFIQSTDWGSSNSNHDCYILLPENLSESTFVPGLRSLFKKYRPAGNDDELTIQSLSEVHYYDAHSHLGNFLGRTIAKSSLRILWIIASFILIAACVNFVNLATAQAVNRAREVGVRKVLGSNKWQLRMQFFTETFLLVVASVLLAFVFAYSALPAVGKILELPLSSEFLVSGGMFIFFSVLIAIVTFLAGFYPAILLSGFNPIESLKSRISLKKTGGISLRRSLVVFQFIIAQGLIISTIIIVRQMNYFSHHSMGFDKTAIVDITMPGDSASNSKIDYLRSVLQGNPGIKTLSFNSQPPVTDDNNWVDFKYNHAPKYNEVYSIMKWADTNYLKTYGLELVAGRNFSSDTAHEVLINERMLQDIGVVSFIQFTLNKEMDIYALKGPIVGVVKDFHSTGFKDKYSRVFLAPDKRRFQHVAIKLEPGDMASTLKSIEKLWNQAFPDYVFEYQFLDKSIENFYKQENQLAQLYKIFAGIAIFLGCLGLYGLVSFLSVQRTREVGIRKVLGASITQIVYLFSREFIGLIGIAFLIAAPIAAYFMHQWLQDYAFRIDITWWIFAMGGLVSILIALATIGYRAVRAAIVNPIISLRSE